MAEEKTTCYTERKNDKDDSRFLCNKANQWSNWKKSEIDKSTIINEGFSVLTFGIESQQEYGRLEKCYQPVWPSWQL